ncbi:hypothetical protein AGIG_G14789 [Arapaima gigas]
MPCRRWCCLLRFDLRGNLRGRQGDESRPVTSAARSSSRQREAGITDAALEPSVPRVRRWRRSPGTSEPRVLIGSHRGNRTGTGVRVRPGAAPAPEWRIMGDLQ